MKFTLIDRLLMVLACVAMVLLAFWAMQKVVYPPTQDAEMAPAEPAPSPSVDVAVLTIALDPTAVPEPSPTLVPDKPAYDPAVPLAEDLQFILRAACEEHGVELALALGVIEVESDFDPSADSGLCYGLMQLNRSYFPSGLPVGENIRYGVEYLGQLLARYDTVEAALTAYNAGHDTGSRVYANAVLAAAEKWRYLNG